MTTSGLNFFRKRLRLQRAYNFLQNNIIAPTCFKVTEEITPTTSSCFQCRRVVTSELSLNLYETQSQMEFECIILQTWWWLKVEALIYFNTPKNETFTAQLWKLTNVCLWLCKQPLWRSTCPWVVQIPLSHTVGLINHHTEFKWRWPQPQRSHTKRMAAFLSQQKLNDGWIECSITHLLFHISSGLFECYKKWDSEKAKKLKRVN